MISRDTAQDGKAVRIVLQYAPCALVLFIIVTLPVLFGAVHPIVQAGYVALILVGLGGWLLFELPALPLSCISWRWLLVPLGLILYLAFQATPLPMALIRILSPARGERVDMVNILAHTDQTLVALGENGVAGLQAAVVALALIVLFVVLSSLMRREQRFATIILYAVASVGLLEGIYGLLQIMNPGIGILWLPLKSQAAHGTIIYKNQYAALMNMCWPMAVATALIAIDPASGQAAAARGNSVPVTRRLARFLSNLRPQVPIFFLAAGVSILAVLFSLSRGGILSMLAVSILLCIFLPLSWRSKLVSMIIFAGFIGAYGSLLGLEGIVARFGGIEHSGSARLQIYQASLPMLFDHWLTGTGFDSFKLLSGVYLKEFPENVLFDRVHSDYLELAIELGLPMATLFFSWIAVGVVLTGRRLSGVRVADDDKRKRQIVGAAAFCALLGFLVHGTVDFGWRLTVNMVYAVTLLALISWALADPTEQSRNGQVAEIAEDEDE